ncbi:hypothetical protein [Nodosilinea sp. P-1105]|uniref:hypothetical protein n=1 Tax=Nodosilinea sp. P-1105 TaxID=2546229 RepID=UPI0016AF5611|nr:hypothetical protein [Nodosilinea sp. P-1105]NMF86711.1 hypothetical protein [Nodosilinea sp. P-1105]
MENKYVRNNLLPIAELIEHFADLSDRLENSESGYALEIEQVNVDLPIELNVSVDDDGAVTLHGSAPTQATRTTFLPVFHRMSLQIVPDDGQ